MIIYTKQGTSKGTSFTKGISTLLSIIPNGATQNPPINKPQPTITNTAADINCKFSLSSFVILLIV